MSVIGGLPNLQVLKLFKIKFKGGTWETRDGEFQQLTFLKLSRPLNLRQWNVASSQHFPKLQRLLLYGVECLLEVPCEIGEIETLELIEVRWCGTALEESVRNIEKEQRSMGNEEPRVIIRLPRQIWNHLSVIHYYVSTFQPDLRTLSFARLFKQNLEKFFLVPKQFDTLKKNELIASFINFLIQLLYEINLVNSLHDELRFLLMVLGDTPFRYNDKAHIINLLAEIEEIANIAGNLVHSLIFKHMAIPILKGKYDSRMTSFPIISKRMVLLKDNILKVSDMLPVIIHESHNINTSKNSSSFFIVDSLICDVSNLLNRDDSLIIGDVKDQFNKLHHELMLSRSLFRGSIMDSSDIQQQVKQIIEVAYEVEYLINYFLAGDAPLWYFSMRLPHVYHKIELIRSGLQEKINNPDIEAPKVAMKNSSISQQLSLKANERNSKVDDNIVVGLEDKVTNILKEMVGGRTNHLQTTFIFGMPGLGKTTLAKKLYNHPSVSCSFDIRSWCVVSQVYQRKALMIDILINLSIDQLDKDNILTMEETKLELKIHQSLKGRRYLIVIDDVWDRNAWDDLLTCFPDDESKSRILITSRNKDVAPLKSIMYELSSLSNEQSWELLERKVFKGESCPSNLLVVGKEITANCCGLPLAVVIVAGILSATDKEENAWKKVAEKVLSYSSCGENDSIIQILELSYTHLPQHLKPCFLYFGVFPEDEEISVGRLTRLWDAEGFLFNDQKNYESSNILAEEYLMELINKSLIMVAKKRSDGGVKACSIHDRLRDLCLKVSKEENFLKRVGDNNESVYEKSHRIVNPRLLSYFPYARSFHCDEMSWISRDPQFFVATMKLVRVLNVLDLKSFYYVFRWIGVEYLVNLRYLVIHGKCLSSSMGSLVNLEYLTVINGDGKIPFLILKMDKLRYLNFTGGMAGFDNDCNPSQKNNLQVISGVFIRNLKDEEMLKCSPHLRRLKCECKPLYVEENGAMKYRHLHLLFFTYLESLTLISNYEIVKTINFPSQIKRLYLQYLYLSSENMSVIGGLPNLQVLKLTEPVFEGEAWKTTDGEFQQLTFLKLDYPDNLRQWNVASSQHFPKLQRLHLYNCYVLKVSCEIGQIATLELIELFNCHKVTKESVRNIEQKQRDNQNEEFRVIIIRLSRKKRDLLNVIYYYVSKFQPDLRKLSYTKLFKQNLEKFFLVPKQFDTFKKNELIASFINFLIQLLYEINLVNSLHDELRFLLMVLGDTPFRYNDKAHIINLLEEIEEIANIAGNLVHSLIFIHMAIPILKGKYDSRMTSFPIISKRMVLLKDNILKVSDMLPVIIHESHNINTSKNSSSFFIVDSLICDVSNLLNRDDSLIIGDVKDQFNKLHHELMLSRSLFRGSIMDSSDIQQQVNQIIEVAYEVEYLIHYFLAGDAPLWYFSMRIPHVFHKIKLIRSRLQEIKNNLDIGALKVAMKNSSISQQLSLKANKINFMVDDNIVVGLNDKFLKIVDKLTGERPNNLQTTFIFGMPGIGKTTLAKKLYNHPLISFQFDRRVWCVVSQVYQRRSLMIDILKSLPNDLPTKDKISEMKEETLEEKIHKILMGRRYLIVIDDMWDINALHDLQTCFPDNGNKSRILITSRNKDVAPLKSIMYELSALSNEQSWELLERKVFKGESCPSNLLVVGKEIAANCHGLPLAVVVVSGILSATDKEENAWKKVAEKVLSYSSCDENDSMMQILKLSYTHLPQRLKPCFLYFGVFPEDKEISVKRLTWLWVAEGFIFNDKQSLIFPEDKEISVKRSNLVAEEYLMELIDKNLIIVAKRRSDGRVKACNIHDRLRNLCLNVSKEENFLKWDNNESVYEKSHRIVNPRLLSYFPYVRSIHGERDPQFYVANMKLVRVLDFRYWGHLIGVEYLVNLRYLVIDGKWLSSSIGSLVNLEYLTVIKGEKIPFLILKMDKLRYLHFTGGWVRFDNDCNPSQTNNLQVLSGVEIRNLKDEEMLKWSPHLRKLKCYCDPLYVEKKGGYLDLLFVTDLESLNMYGKLGDCKVERINFPSQIKRLHLSYLRLSSENMSVIGGLPNLQVLKLTSPLFEVETWETRDGEFQQLTFLNLKYPSNLRQWNVASSQHFPKLQRLLLYGVECLLEVPCEIGEIETLELIEVRWCGTALEESVRNIEKEQRSMENEEPRVLIIK